MTGKTTGSPKSSAQVWNNWEWIWSCLWLQAEVRWLRLESEFSARHEIGKDMNEHKPGQCEDSQKFHPPSPFWGELWKKVSHQMLTHDYETSKQAH